MVFGWWYFYTSPSEWTSLWWMSHSIKGPQLAHTGCSLPLLCPLTGAQLRLQSCWLSYFCSWFSTMAHKTSPLFYSFSFNYFSYHRKAILTFVPLSLPFSFFVLSFCSFKSSHQCTEKLFFNRNSTVSTLLVLLGTLLQCLIPVSQIFNIFITLDNWPWPRSMHNFPLSSKSLPLIQPFCHCTSWPASHSYGLGSDDMLPSRVLPNAHNHEDSS